MKTTRIVGTAGCLLALSLSGAALAQQDCSDLVFTGDITSRFPNVRDACLGVETREGRPYAHFQARIRSVRGDTVEAEFKMPDGSYGRPISLTPDPDTRLRIAGRSYRWRDLSRGQELDVWLPPDRWEIAVPSDTDAQFAAAPAVTTLAISEPSPAVAANTLPRTASALPLIGALGGVLAVLGFGVAVIRRRLL